MPRAWSQIEVLQGNKDTLVGATANGNGFVADTLGVDSAQQVEIQEQIGGTATVTIQGSLDGATWYAVGYQQVDAVAAPTRAAAAIGVLANAKHIYQVLDPYPQLRAVISAIAAAQVLIRLYEIGT